MRHPPLPREELLERLKHRLDQAHWCFPVDLGLPYQQRAHDPWQHEQRHGNVHPGPGDVVGQDQRQPTGNQAGQPVCAHVDGVSHPQLFIRKDLPTECVERNVLSGAQKTDGDGHAGNPPHRLRGIEQPHTGDGRQQRHLTHQHPSAAPPQRKRVPIQQRGPQKLPRVGEHDKGKCANGLEAQVVGSQPGRDQRKEIVEREAGGESNEHAHQHARIPDGFPDGGLVGHTRRSTSPARLDARCALQFYQVRVWLAERTLAADATMTFW